MSKDNLTIQDIEVMKARGWTPNYYLTNMSMAEFEDSEFASRRLFPICPVQVSSGNYYRFSKADLARDNVQRKPEFGKVAPAITGTSDDAYHCIVEQVIAGLDQIMALDYQRTGAPGVIDPRRGKVRFIAEQMNLHQELKFAKNFFNKGVWSNEWTGAATGNDANKQFKKFDNTDADPIAFFDARSIEIRRQGRRSPNKLALGIETFAALKNNPSIKERIKYTGTTTNPALVNESVLAQCFGVKEIVVLDATYNAAPYGQEDMQFVCDSKGALLLYTPDSPAIDEPSAGYNFAWDMLGDGNYIATSQWVEEKGIHAEFVEGLMATDMRKTGDSLAIYFADCVG